MHESLMDQTIENKIDSLRDQLNGDLSLSEQVELKARVISLKKDLSENADSNQVHLMDIEQLLGVVDRVLMHK
ncbi:MAG: hypothetical protein HRU09_20240 [Oligoflexales bacterium]|nr:hypothetical protein [Oligoflexales bacterium]